jgi:hypothetical protein
VLCLAMPEPRLIRPAQSCFYSEECPMRSPDATQVRLSRRQLVLGASSLAAVPLVGGYARAAPAHTFKQGAFDITIISDGFLSLG